MSRPKKYSGTKQERNRKAVAEHYKKNKDKINQKVRLNKYRIHPEEYMKIDADQNGKCAICGSDDKLFIDHSHSNNKVRGLLCRKCNTGLGYFKDSVSILENATKYLKKNY